jgi:hypothetical protein
MDAATDSHRYRGFDIYVLANGTCEVRRVMGKLWSTEKDMAAAKAEVDRLLVGKNRTDASEYGCPL